MARQRKTEVEKEIMRHIAVNLKRILKERKITQKELAELTGISTSAISDYLNEKTLMAHSIVQIIAVALKIDAADFYPGLGKETKESANALPENDMNRIIRETEEHYGVNLRNDPVVLEAMKQLIENLAKIKKENVQ